MAGFERLTLILSAWFALLVSRAATAGGAARLARGVAIAWPVSLLNLACILACRRHTGVDSTLLGVFRQGGAFR